MTCSRGNHLCPHLEQLQRFTSTLITGIALLYPIHGVLSRALCPTPIRSRPDLDRRTSFSIDYGNRLSTVHSLSAG